MKNMKRLVVYIPEEDHKKLKAKLALMGNTITNWIRVSIKKFLKSFERERDYITTADTREKFPEDQEDQFEDVKANKLLLEDSEHIYLEPNDYYHTWRQSLQRIDEIKVSNIIPGDFILHIKDSSYRNLTEAIFDAIDSKPNMQIFIEIIKNWKKVLETEFQISGDTLEDTLVKLRAKKSSVTHRTTIREWQYGSVLVPRDPEESICRG